VYTLRFLTVGKKILTFKTKIV